MENLEYPREFKENVLVSKCLIGIPCRWHGRDLPVNQFVHEFIHDNLDVNLIPVCPEVMGGMTTPRRPSKIMNGRVYETCDNRKYRIHNTGEDVTDFFVKGARMTLQICKDFNVKRAILCKYSPSCDKGGITGSLLRKNGITVINTF